MNKKIQRICISSLGVLLVGFIFVRVASSGQKVLPSEPKEIGDYEAFKASLPPGVEILEPTPVKIPKQPKLPQKRASIQELSPPTRLEEVLSPGDELARDLTRKWEQSLIDEGWVNPDGSQKCVPGEVVVQFKNEVRSRVHPTTKQGVAVFGISSIDRINEKHSAQRLDRVVKPETIKKGKEESVMKHGLDLIYVIEFAKDADVQAIVEEYLEDPAIDEASPNWQSYPLDIPRKVPDDPYYISCKWCWEDNRFPEAWDDETGDQAIILAHICLGPNQSTGAMPDTNYPDLNVNYAHFYGGTTSNYITNHASCCVATIAARANNTTKQPGAAGGWAATKGCSWTFYGMKNSSADQVSAYVWCADNGITAANASFGSNYPGAGVEAAVNYCVDNGCLIVASAGNEDYRHICYPAHFGNVISAAGTWRGVDDHGHECLWGYHPQVSLCATVGVYGVGYDSLVLGTSFSAPKVTGTIGLMKSKHPGWTATQLRDYVIQSAHWIDYIPANIGLSGDMGGGDLNAYEALNIHNRNVAVNRIFVPLMRPSTDDVIGPGRLIYPQVVVQNHGTSKVTFKVTLEIDEGAYKDTRLVDGLSSRLYKDRKGRVITFDPWNTGTGNPPQLHSFRAYTSLIGDQNTENDTIYDHLLVSAGAVDAIDTLEYEASAPSWYFDEANYCYAVHIQPDSPCKLLAILFYGYTLAPGNYSIYSWNDDGSTNPGTVKTGPQNYTETSAGWRYVPIAGTPYFTGDFQLGFKCPGGTHGPFLVSDDGPGTGHSTYSCYGGVGTWKAWNTHNWCIRAVVQYLPPNDTDVTVTELIRPRAHELSKRPFIPQAVVKNVGSQTQGIFGITLDIDSASTNVYTNVSSTTKSLNPGESDTVSFAAWAPQADSFEYDATCYTQLATDQNRSNDTLYKEILVTKTDTLTYDDNCAVWYYADSNIYWAVVFEPDYACSVIGCETEIYVQGTTPPPCTLIGCDIVNDTPALGTRYTTTTRTLTSGTYWYDFMFGSPEKFHETDKFALVLWLRGIANAEQDTVCARSDGTDEDPWNSFWKIPSATDPSWEAVRAFDLMMRAIVKYAGDPPDSDVAVVSIDNPEPYEFVYPYRATTPRVTVENLGFGSVTFNAVFEVDDSLGVQEYTDTKSVTLNLVEAKQVSFDAWYPQVDDMEYTMTAYTTLVGDQYTSNDTLSHPVYCRAIDSISYNEEYWGEIGIVDTGMIYYAVKFTPEKPCIVWGAILNMWTAKDSCTTPCTLFLWKDTLCRPSSAVMDAETFSMVSVGATTGGYISRFRLNFNDTLPPDSNYIPDTCQPIGSFFLGVSARTGTGVGTDSDTVLVAFSDCCDWYNIDGRSVANVFGYDSTGRWYSPLWIFGDDTSQADWQIKALVKYDNYPCDPPIPADIMVNKSSNNAVVFWDSVKIDVSGNPTMCDHFVAYDDTSRDYVPGLDYFFTEGPDTTFTHTNALTSGIDHNYLVYIYDKYRHKSSKSNMGYVLFRDINENPGVTADRNWINLPWHCPYNTVSNLVADLSPAAQAFNKVTNLDEATQNQFSYFWHAGLARWLGTNFAILPGHFYEFTAIKDTTLVFVGSNYPDSSRLINENPGVTGDRNWVCLPYNAAYSMVSDITDELAPSGSPINKVTNLVDTTQTQFSWFYHTLLARWLGTDFAIVPGDGYEMTAIKDSAWNPTEWSNDGGTLLARGSRQSDIKMYLGQLNDPDRAPVWLVERRPVNQVSRKPIDYADARVYEPVKRSVEKKVGGRVPGISHLVIADLRSDEFENLVFTAYRPDRPYDALTENMVGSGIASQGDVQVMWFDVANFKEPWEDDEEIVVIIEATKEGRGYFTVLNVCLELGNELQHVGEISLMPIPEPEVHKDCIRWERVENDDVVGYSLYHGDKRLNNKIIAEKEYLTIGEVVLKPVIKGGYETVYTSREGPQSTPDTQIPISYAFAIFPNPFTRTTGINYALPHQTQIDIKIYDVSGRLVRTVVSDKLEPGYYTADWSGDDDMARKVSAGIYFVRMITKEYKSQHKVIFVR